MGKLDRRQFLARVGAAASFGALAGAARPAAAKLPFDPGDWTSVREQFELSRDLVHMSALFIASHPRPVRRAIEEGRRALDRAPVPYLVANNGRLRRRALSAAAEHLGARRSEIALTDSTTMGLGLIYNGVRLEPGDEILTTEHDYYVTHEAVRLAAARSGATVRKVALYDRLEGVSEDEIVGRLAAAIRPETRVIALTWVHSGTGLKIPLARIAEPVRRAERARGRRRRILLCVDAAHALGVEDIDVEALGVDFFAAGCHKWLYGPRGTGIVWGTARAWRQCLPFIPSFIDHDRWRAWREGEELDEPTTAAGMTPGGFQTYEHRWALAEAFGFHRRIGKGRIAARTHQLAGRLKEGLAEMKGIHLRTPMPAALSSGIVCFDIDGMSPFDAVPRLRRRGIVATVTPYAARHVRLGPSIRNSAEEVDRALDAVRGLARSG